MNNENNNNNNNNDNNNNIFLSALEPTHKKSAQFYIKNIIIGHLNKLRQGHKTAAVT